MTQNWRRTRKEVPVADSFSYVAKCPRHGQVFAAVVDDPERAQWTADHVAEMIASGGIVERVPSEEVKRVFGCDRGYDCKNCDGFETGVHVQERLL